jgi:hypothetical protein
VTGTITRTFTHTCSHKKTHAYTQPCVLGFNCSCCANLTHICASDDDCGVYEQGSPCGCVEGGAANGICGPFCPVEKPQRPELECILTKFISYNASARLWGKQCTYVGPKTVGTSTQPLIESCLAPAFITTGSAFGRVLQLVSTESAGSKYISFYGGNTDVNEGMKNLEYVTNKGYNRHYRYREPCVLLLCPCALVMRAFKTHASKHQSR